jgi:GDP/UDP-N,N'-diacetylbacillosamine 2-epimerase (hydrolysing)
VTGAHLSADFGYTYREIEADGLKIGVKIDILTEADTARAVSESMALAISGFAAYFEQSKPDALLVLGDRYETLAVCCAAMNARVPIMHLHGGETTQGAIDEAVRHAVTKMSLLLSRATRCTAGASFSSERTRAASLTSAPSAWKTR